MAPEVHVIYGGQFGSESKRLFTEFYANKWKPDIIITNALPNSGGYDSKGDKWAALPIGYPCKMLISPGSAIDMKKLKKEAEQLPEGASIVIHQHAAIVQKKHFGDEESFVRIGSTMTGGAAAVMEKMSRNPESPIVAKDILVECATNKEWMDEIFSAKKILVICAQGHSLSINYGFFPYCTSRNTSPAQAVADAGIPMQWVKRVIGCFRTFPIRVSNRYDDQGNQVGFSGPCYPDQRELSWEDVGVPPEITSISKKVRRVFTFSHDQLQESVLLNGTTDVFLNFMNYLDPLDSSAMLDATENTLLDLEGSLGFRTRVSWTGWGPTVDSIVSR